MAAAFPLKSALARAFEQKLPPDFKDITVMHTYEDKGVSVNTVGAVAPQRWIVAFGPLLSEAQAAIIDAHFADAGFVETFNFTDRYGVTHTGVMYLDYDYPEHGKITQQSRRCTLIKRPA